MKNLNSQIVVLASFISMKSLHFSIVFGFDFDFQCQVVEVMPDGNVSTRKINRRQLLKSSGKGKFLSVHMTHFYFLDHKFLFWL